MRSTFIAAFTAAFTAAFVTTAGASIWDYERSPIPEGQVVELPASGTLKLAVKAPRHRTRARCAVTGTMALWNATNQGRAEMRSISFACGSVTTVTPTLPWPSALEGPVRSYVWVDLWQAALDVTARGSDLGTFSGTLDPTIGDGDPQGPGLHDDLDNTFSFHSTGARLKGSGGAALSLVGFVKAGDRGSGVTSES